eukprot:2573432-Rhodomonas_salina.3
MLVQPEGTSMTTCSPEVRSVGRAMRTQSRTQGLPCTALTGAVTQVMLREYSGVGVMQRLAPLSTTA